MSSQVSLVKSINLEQSMEPGTKPGDVMVSLGHTMIDHTDTKSVVIKFSYLSSTFITKIKFSSVGFDVP